MNSNSAYILQNVNDTNYLVYAPQLSANGLELYFTRLRIGSFDTELCVSVRSSVSDPFSAPMVQYSDYPNFPEAVTIDSAASLMYYHKKTNGTYALYVRYRSPVSIAESQSITPIVYPVPASQQLQIDLPESLGTICTIIDMSGKNVLFETNTTTLNISALADGVYILTIQTEQSIWHQHIQIKH
jgi:hypothetical protein